VGEKGACGGLPPLAEPARLYMRFYALPERQIA